MSLSVLLQALQIHEILNLSLTHENLFLVTATISILKQIKYFTSCEINRISPLIPLNSIL